MRVLLLTDIHGEVDKLERILSIEEYDTVLCAGDLSDASNFESYEENLDKILDAFDRKGKLVKAVPGNMDVEDVAVKKLIDYRMNLHKNIASFEDFEVVGFGGARTPFNTYFEPEEEEIKTTLDTLYSRMQSDNRLAVIHNPPKGARVDLTEEENVGSDEVRELVASKEFKLVLTGHVHEARGKERIGGTLVVNPGPVSEGFYAVADIEDRSEVEMKQV
ncbi:MAG: metallophosphoesterase family protein [Candidatus Nanohaloarchaeota archaeon QJJ-9]|nr:metallophosphoesterase family protein [Candidatus Nanohaloarchaeota archaeon QJJ-9]